MFINLFEKVYIIVKQEYNTNLRRCAMEEAEVIAFRLPKKEAKMFDKAIEKSGRFMNRSDALRHFVRQFIQEMGVKE